MNECGEVSWLYKCYPRTPRILKEEMTEGIGWVKQRGPLVQYSLCDDYRELKELPAWDSFVAHVGDTLDDLNGKLTRNGKPMFFAECLHVFGGSFFYSIFPNIQEMWMLYKSDQLRSWCPEVEIVQYWQDGIYGIKYDGVLRDYRYDYDFFCDYVYICFLVKSGMEVPRWIDKGIDISYESGFYVLRKNSRVMGYGTERKKIVEMMDDID